MKNDIVWRTTVYRKRFGWSVVVHLTVGIVQWGPDGGGWYGFAFRESSIPKVEERLKTKARRRYIRSLPVDSRTSTERGRCCDA